MNPQTFSGRLTGTFTAPAQFMRGGVIELDQPQGEYTYAVVSPDTGGVSSFLSSLGEDAMLVSGLRMAVSKWQEGGNALRAVELALPTEIEEKNNQLLLFSRRIDEYTATFSSSRWKRIKNRFEYFTRRRKNEPLPFWWVKESTGELVGPGFELHHPTLHDMVDFGARGMLTGQVLLKGEHINAFSTGETKHLGGIQGATPVQPRWVEKFV